MRQRPGVPVSVEYRQRFSSWDEAFEHRGPLGTRAFGTTSWPSFAAARIQSVKAQEVEAETPRQTMLAWAAAYARRLEACGIIGSGTVTLQVLPEPPRGLGAIAMVDRQHLVLSPAALGGKLSARLLLLHELVHLGQAPDSLGFPLLFEAVTTFITLALALRLHPRELRATARLSHRLLPYRETLTLHEVLGLRNPGGRLSLESKRRIWLVHRGHPDTLWQVEKRVLRRHTPRQLARLDTWRISTGKAPKVRALCAREHHIDCLHSMTDAVLAWGFAAEHLGLRTGDGESRLRSLAGCLFG